jgi:hypothetical protein
MAASRLQSAQPAPVVGLLHFCGVVVQPDTIAEGHSELSDRARKTARLYHSISITEAQAYAMEPNQLLHAASIQRSSEYPSNNPCCIR